MRSSLLDNRLVAILLSSVLHFQALKTSFLIFFAFSEIANANNSFRLFSSKISSKDFCFDVSQKWRHDQKQIEIIIFACSSLFLLVSLMLLLLIITRVLIQ